MSEAITITTTPSQGMPRRFQWNIEAYEALSGVPHFDNKRVELVDGEILEMAPMNEPHAIAIGLCDKALRRTFGEQVWVRIQMPFVLDKFSEPEPDLAVVSGAVETHTGKDRPKTALLIVEVADSTLQYDLGRKATLYASGGILDYWVIDTNNKQVLVHRQPIASSLATNNARYGEIHTFKSGDSISPLSTPNSTILVSDLLL